MTPSFFFKISLEFDIVRRFLHKNELFVFNFATKMSNKIFLFCGSFSKRIFFFFRLVGYSKCNCITFSLQPLNFCKLFPTDNYTLNAIQQQEITAIYQITWVIIDVERG